MAFFVPGRMYWFTVKWRNRGRKIRWSEQSHRWTDLPLSYQSRRRRQGGIVPPPSVLVPGSALRSCHQVALPSAQAISHRSRTALDEAIASRRSTRRPGRRTHLLPPFTGGLQLTVAVSEDRGTTSGQLVSRSNVTDRRMKMHFIVAINIF
jgi:hypothetical protein